VVCAALHKKSGVYVQAGDALLTLETDKVSTEITAERAGLLETRADEGQEVKIGEVVAVIDDQAKAPAKAKSASPNDSAKGKAPSPPASKKLPNAETLSPAVRRLTTEEKIDPGALAGSGKGGRLTKGDVLAHL